MRETREWEKRKKVFPSPKIQSQIPPLPPLLLRSADGAHLVVGHDLHLVVAPDANATEGRAKINADGDLACRGSHEDEGLVAAAGEG